MNTGTFILIVAALTFVAYIAGRFHHRTSPSATSTPSIRPHIDYAAQQLDTVMKSAYAAQPLMNKGEYRVFKLIEQHLKDVRSGQRVFSQVSLGEVLTATGAAYDAINSKRVDFLVIGPFGMPEVAIEHQGAGHYGGNAAARDAIKKEALRRAGIALVETFDSDSDDAILQKVFPPRDMTSAPLNGSVRSIRAPT